MNWTEYLTDWSQKYRDDLVNDIMPFWLKNGLDRVNGGVYTCVNRDGTLIDSTKSVWFQGRFAFVCSFAYNTIEKNPEWLAAAKSTIDFIEAHCFDTDGRMYFEVMADGTPLRKRRYVFSESFAAIAMAEYAKASGDMTYAQKALKLFKDIRKFVATPGYMAFNSLAKERDFVSKTPHTGHWQNGQLSRVSLQSVLTKSLFFSAYSRA